MRRYLPIVIPVLGAVVVLAGYLLSGNLNQNLTYYLTPSEAVAKQAYLGDQRFRLGGLVEGTVTRTEEQVRFTVVGNGASVPIVYLGAPAQLFAPGIGVVVEGSWRDGTFISDDMMVKHDENYRPPEAASSESPAPRR